MKLKTYQARSIADALEQVKKDLGRDAVILHTRTYKVGGWLGFGGRNMFEVTASSGMHVVQPSRLRARAAERESTPDPAAVAARLLRQAYGQTGPASAAASGAVAAENASARDARREVVRITAGATAASVMAARPIPAERPAPGLTVAGQAAMAQELAAIKSMVARVLSGAGGGRLGAGCAVAGDALTQQYLRMLESEVAADIADEVVGRAREELTRAQLSDEKAVQKAVLRALSGHIPVAPEAGEPAPERGADGRPFTVALIGPTGVGKTTTVAKLAATYKLRHGRKVGLVTADTYRIAAVEQLRVYANIIGLPMHVAMTPAEMAGACAALADRDVILIDTAGRSHNDDSKLEELRAYLEAAKPHRTHLVLSSAASEASMVRSAERFAVAKPDRVIFTKLDEAVSFGVLVNVARRIGARLSYLTTGQEVPDRIEAGKSERLARMVMEGAVLK